MSSQRLAPPAAWLIAIGLGGLTILALSLVPGWLLHARHLGGHGLTELDTLPNAWQTRSVPVISAGVVLAGLAGIAALAALARPGRLLSLLMLGGSAGAAALLLSGLWPISHPGHASSVDVSARWPLILAALLALGMATASVISLGGTRLAVAGAAAAVVLLMAAGAAGGRQVLLDLQEGTGRHWQDGSYTRAAEAGQPAETLTIHDGTFRIGDRWSGTFSGEGLVVVLTDDPACPDKRGSYHLFGAGGKDVRFEQIVDTCADGERGADLMTGIWKRDD